MTSASLYVRLAAGSVLLALLTAGSVALAQPSRVAEQSIKAAYLYKFASYVEWPEDPLMARGAPMTIGVMGATSLAEELATITAGRNVGDRPIEVRSLMAGEPLDDVHILFIRQQDDHPLNALLAPTRSRPILTVTDADGALTQGSIINFIVNEERVRFEISLRSAAQNQLRLSARLLAVAESVVETGR